MSAQQSAAISRVAIVDDDENERKATKVRVEDAGFEPIMFDAGYSGVEELVQKIRDSADAAVCDHRLAPGGYLNRTGAEVVATLFKRQIPSLLVTQFIDMDYDVSIRRWRRWIPVLLKRDEAEPDVIADGFNRCLQELRGNSLPGRAPRRTMVRVVERSTESYEEVLDVIVPGWRSKEAVRLPLDLLPAAWRADVAKGMRLFAEVNIGAERPEDLFFEYFEQATNAVGDDELANG